MYLMQDYQLVLQKIHEEIPVDGGISVRAILKEMGFYRGEDEAMRRHLIEERYICHTRLAIERRVDFFTLTEKGFREVQNLCLE
jgi:DNA-binding MarR family transcriptional regulator